MAGTPREQGVGTSSTERHRLPTVSVVVVTYRRLELLRRTLESFREHCTYPSIEWILTDDGSPRKIQEAMRALPFDRFVFSERNEGLGRNTNKGLLAASGSYLFQLQDDWLCRGPADFLDAGIEVFAEFRDVALVRFREMHQEAPHEKRRTRAGRIVRVYENGMGSPDREYPYSDNPHLKRREFHERLGHYREGVPMTAMEIDFRERVDAQRDLRVAFIEGYGVFEHIGEDLSFNPGQRRIRLRRALERSWVTRRPLELYLALRGRKRRGPA